MDGANDAFYFVIDKIIDIQRFFIGTSMRIGRVVFLLAILLAALNHALNGTGLRDNAIKIGKATAFFLIVIFAYPTIVSFISSWTMDLARSNIYPALQAHSARTRDDIMNAGRASRRVFGQSVIEAEGEEFFGEIFATHRHPDMEVTTVAPAAVLRVVLLISGEFLRYAEQTDMWTLNIAGSLLRVLLGSVMAFALILTALFALLEYIIAFLEFILVASVGVILFPLVIWEGSRFMSEKYVGAMVGFFVKLLFCNIAMFLMLYLFLSLAGRFAVTPFTGRPDEIIFALFVCLLSLFICKSAPGMAQGLLSGTPSLSATGAISAATGAVGAAIKTAAIAKTAGGAIAGGVARDAFAGAGTAVRAYSAAKAVGTLGGGAGDMAKAFAGSVGHSATESFKARGGDLARSLIGGGGGGRGSGGGLVGGIATGMTGGGLVGDAFGGGSGGGSGAGINRHSETQKFLGQTNADGTKKSFGEYLGGRAASGTNAGIDYMARKEAGKKTGKGG